MGHLRKIVAAACWLVFVLAIVPGALGALKSSLSASDGMLAVYSFARVASLLVLLCVMAVGHWQWTQGRRLHVALVVVLAIAGIGALVPTLIRPHNIEILFSMMPIFPLSLFIAVQQVISRSHQKALP